MHTVYFLVAQCDTLQQMSRYHINVWFKLSTDLKKRCFFFFLLFKLNTSLLSWQTSLHVIAEKKQVRVSTMNVQQHVCLSSCISFLPRFVISQPSESIYFFYPPTMPCRFSATGTIWELLSSSLAKNKHNGSLSAAPTSGGNHRNTSWG